jgi:hypothetical protein
MVLGVGVALGRGIGGGPSVADRIAQVVDLVRARRRGRAGEKHEHEPESAHAAARPAPPHPGLRPVPPTHHFSHIYELCPHQPSEAQTGTTRAGSEGRAFSD